ncbi:restriction endonuclease subunit S [Ellagibacter isourolithinifaciens]|uniref:restriction endonuclease subunit S n=1 Tax=Ellagibacter isourolithinifaciens TaxID=2137581 RepID=UPI003F8BCC63
MGIGTWHNTRLKDQLMIVGGNGFSPDLQGHNKGDYPFCKCSDISSSDKLSTAANYVSFKDIIEQGYNLVPAYSILVAKIGESMKKNRRSLNLVPCCIDNNMQAFVPKGSLDPLFGYYLLSLIDFADYDNGGPVPSINNQRLMTKVVSIPSIREQKEITSLLGEKCIRIDGVVSTLETQISTLERYRTSVIHEAVTRGLDPSAPTKPSGVDWIGEIPKKWGVKRIKYLFHTASGSTPDSSDWTLYDGDINWVQSGDLYGVSSIEKTARTVTAKALMESSALKVFESPFVIMAMYGASVGNVAVCNIDACTNQACCVMLPHEGMDSRFLYYVLVDSQTPLKQKALGGTQPNISQVIIKNHKVPLPSSAEQKAIADYLDARTAAIDAVLDTKRKQLDVLKRRRKSLIYEYVTGKRRVNQEA